MNTWVILLRGINVGGTGTLAMKDLRLLLENIGFTNVKTYIQSGNCVLQTTIQSVTEIESMITNAIEDNFGLRPKLLAIPSNEFATTMHDVPFPECQADPKSLHVFFLSQIPHKPNIQFLESLLSPTEQYVLLGKRLYLYAPDGVGKSKFFAQAEKILGVSATARNLRSILKIIELCK